MKSAHQQAKGAILLMTVLIMGAGSFIGFLALTRVSISRFVTSQEVIRANVLRAKTYGCLDEALIWLQEDPNWSDTSVTTLDATCTITISTPQSGQRLILVRLADNELQYGLNVVVTDSDINILSITPTLP